MARAYLLAAAVATGHLGYRTFDELLVLGSIEGLAEDFLGCRHHEAGHIFANRLDGLLSLGLDLLASSLRDALGLLLRLLFGFLPQLLAGPGGTRDDLLCRDPCLLQVFLSLGQPGFGVLARLLGCLELGSDGLLTRLGRFDQTRVYVPSENSHHQEKCGELDPERRIDVKELRDSQIHGYWTPPATAKMKTNARARLMKYIPSTRAMIRNRKNCIRACASGWRATPAMVALPARPSPIAAPIAPPPRARAPARRAPA